MSTIDERGRAAAATLRQAMDEDFDVEAGLTLVQAEQVVVRLSEPEPPRRVWMFAAAAAVALGLVGVGVVALRDRDRVDITETPTVPATTPVSVPSASTVPDVSTQTTVEPAPTSTSDASLPATTITPSGDRTVIVADVVQTVDPVRASIASLGFGTGAGQLAVESCQECEPARPWAPVHLVDGRVLIADTANGRWVVIESSPSDSADAASTRTTEVPWPDGVVVNSEPVVDDAGTVYALMFGPLGVGGTRAGQLWVLDPSNLATPLSTHPASSTGNARIELTTTQVIVDGAVIDGLTPVIATRPIVEFLPPDPLASPNGTELRVVWQDVTTTFAYASDELPSFFGPMPTLADGSVIIVLTLDSREFVDRLTPDGQVHRLQLPPVGSVFGSGSVAQSGFLRLEVASDPATWDLAHYDLP